MKRVQGGERHGRSPAGAIVARTFGTVAGQDDPSFALRFGAVERNVVTVIPVKIARRKNDEDRPGFSRIEICRHRENRDGFFGNTVAAERRVGFLFAAEGDQSGRGFSSLNEHSFEDQAGLGSACDRSRRREAGG